MGPYSEAKQLQRAEAIGFLLDNNPQLDPVYRAMWENKLRALSQNEEEYNRRVVGIYKDKNINYLKIKLKIKDKNKFISFLKSEL